jgi:hypothetical protein
LQFATCTVLFSLDTPPSPLSHTHLPLSLKLHHCTSDGGCQHLLPYWFVDLLQLQSKWQHRGESTSQYERVDTREDDISRRFEALSIQEQHIHCNSFAMHAYNKTGTQHTALPTKWHDAPASDTTVTTTATTSAAAPDFLALTRHKLAGSGSGSGNTCIYIYISYGLIHRRMHAKMR